ncbi:MAG: hypothetical protein ABSE69_08110 [Roseiarcus sp.]|jgi:hypothetical protein
MWTLVIIVLVNPLGPNGGTSAAISSLDFSDQAKCEAAARTIGVKGGITNSPGGGQQVDRGAFQILAQCVAR